MSSISIPFCGHILCVTMQSKNTSAHIVQPNTNTIKLFLLFMQFGLCQSESRNARNEQLAHEAHRGPNGAPSIPCRLTTMRSTKFSHPLLYYAPVSSSPHPKLYARRGPYIGDAQQPGPIVLCISRKWVCHKCVSVI